MVLRLPHPWFKLKGQWTNIKFTYHQFYVMEMIKSLIKFLLSKSEDLSFDLQDIGKIPKMGRWKLKMGEVGMIRT